MRVLILDSNPVVWKHLFDMLGEQYSLSTLAYASTLAEARNCLSSLQPDLLVMDIVLPDGNGLDLMKELRTAGSATKVAVFTNNPEFRRRSLDQGADWYFDKSLDFHQLLFLLNDQEYWRNQGVTIRRHTHVKS